MLFQAEDSFRGFLVEAANFI